MLLLLLLLLLLNAITIIIITQCYYYYYYYYSMILLLLLLLLLQYPSLRTGAVSGCIEEWAEGKLFLHYSQTKAVAVLGSFLPVDVDSSEYIGRCVGSISRIYR